MPSVLVIDDEKGILGFVREALTHFGHRVETAADGKEGIQKFDDGSFDVVITDFCMPGVDGIGVLQHIRGSSKNDIPIVGISGTPWQLNGADFDLVLPKPFLLQELVNAIRSLTSVSAETSVAACAG